MKGCTVGIKKNVTGEVRAHRVNEPWCEYAWEDGNESCDCNRHLYFERAGGRDDGSEWDGAECGVTAYSIAWYQNDGEERVDLPHGECVTG